MGRFFHKYFARHPVRGAAETDSLGGVGGQKSGGGACTVGYLSTAIGSTMQISSEYRLSTMKNGYIRDIDGGIAPDIYLSTNKLFDREYINNLLNEQFADKETKN